MKTSKQIIQEALKRAAERERGLRIVEPNEGLSNGHAKKSDHDLNVMTDLNKLGHTDWTVVAAYYSMYHAATAVLLKIGLESKDHATTVAVLEYFFNEKIDKFLLSKFNEIKERVEEIEKLKIQEKYIVYIWDVRNARETVQYGIETAYKETEIVMKYAREFAAKMKFVLEDINDNFLKFVTDECNKLIL